MQRITVIALVLIGCSGLIAQDSLPVDHHPMPEFYQGWQLAVHARSYESIPFERMIDVAGSVGVNWIVGYPGQGIGADFVDTRMNYTLDSDARAAIKDILAEAGLYLAGYDLSDQQVPKDHWQQVFEFCSDMGVEIVIVNVAPDQMDIVERLSQQFKVKVALAYTPDMQLQDVLELCSGRSSNIGIHVDVGQLIKQGENPVGIIAEIQSRLLSVGMSDLDRVGDEGAGYVAWGQGQAGVQEILHKLHEQSFAGLISIAHRYNGPSDLSGPSVDFYETVAKGLQSGGWRSLFKHDLSNARYPANQWAFRDGILTGRASKIWANEQYEDFILDLQWRSLEGVNSNSGVFVRTEDIDNPIRTGIEVQIEEYYTWQLDPAHKSGAIYGVVPARQGLQKPAGQWNRFTITWKGSMLYVVFNGQQAAMMDASRYDQPHPMFDKLIKEFDKGQVGLQYHGGTIWFRNIRIKPLE